MLNQTVDPDYYYHVAISKQILEQGIPHSVPQATGIGWNILFSDKEFLFHQFSALFYYFLGEKGIQILPFVISAATALVMAWRSLKRLPLQYALLPFLIIAADPYFIRRMMMVRPQVLAIFFFTLLLYGLLSRRKFLVLIATILFTLSYHALQIPVLVLIAGLLTLNSKDVERRNCLAALGLGLVSGVLINPYFPGNLTIIPQIFDIVLGAQNKADLRYGAEIYPWQSNILLNYSLITFAILSFSLYCLGALKARQQESAEYRDQKMLVLLAFIFFAVSCMTPRGREYLIPCVFFLSIFAIEQRHELTRVFKSSKVPLAIITFVICVLAQFFLIHKEYSILTSGTDASKEMFALLDKIPADEKAHVFNCNWSHTPYIMYKRPQLTFVDIMDPSFLLREAKPLHQAREDFMKMKFTDPYFVTRHIFKAKYFVCDAAATNELFDKDPRFIRLYPENPVKMSQTTMALFMLPEQDHYRHFVTHYLYQVGQKESSANSNWRSIQAALPVSPDKNVPLQPIDYFDFKLILGKNELVQTVFSGSNGNEATLSCVTVQPDPSEMQKYQGAEYFGVGGGPNLRVWLNETPLFESRGEPEYATNIHTLIPLPHALTTKDHLKVMVCPGVTAKFYGVSLSFFTSNEINKLCEEKGSPDTLSQRSQLKWTYKGDSAKTCLANLAAKR
jgi:hypothetical protein